jgi:hypothetical protein
MDKEKIIIGLVTISIITLIIFMLWFMFGNSPTTEQLLLLLVLPVYLFMFGIYERLNNKVINTREQILLTRESLQRGLGEIKFTLGKLNGKFGK